MGRAVNATTDLVKEPAKAWGAISSSTAGLARLLLLPPDPDTGFRGTLGQAKRADLPRQFASPASRVPGSAGVALGAGTLSHAGNVWLGLAADAGVIPDPERILDAFHREVERVAEPVRRAGRPTPSRSDPHL